MRVSFKDGSFISINKSDINPDKLSVIVCGMKGPREVTMSSLELDKADVVEMIGFLQSWVDLQ